MPQSKSEVRRPKYHLAFIHVFRWALQVSLSHSTLPYCRHECSLGRLFCLRVTPVFILAIISSLLRLRGFILPSLPFFSRALKDDLAVRELLGFTVHFIHVLYAVKALNSPLFVNFATMLYLSQF